MIIAYFDNFTNVVTSWHFSNQKAKFVSNITIARSVLTLLTGFIFYFLKLPNYLLLSDPAFYSLLRFTFLSCWLVKDYNFSLREFIFHSINKSDIRIIFKDTWVFGSLSFYLQCKGKVTLYC